MRELPKRKPNRLREYDYSRNGAYFVTICAAQKRHIFGRVVDGKMQLNALGQIALNEIYEIPKHREYVQICHAVVMPNHVHILSLVSRGMTCHAREQVNQFAKPVANGLGMIVGAYKASVTRKWTVAVAGMTSHAPTTTAPIWQRGYHDHIIRNDADFKRILTYIDENPLKWELDRYYCEGEQEEPLCLNA